MIPHEAIRQEKENKDLWTGLKTEPMEHRGERVRDCGKQMEPQSPKVEAYLGFR